MANDYYETLGVSKKDLQNLAEKYAIERLALFGSFVRGEQTEESDVDLLVRWGSGRRGLRRVFGFKADLEKYFGRDVDIVSEDFVYDDLKDQILSEARDLI